MLAGTTICKACGYELTDRHRAAPRGWSMAIFIGAAVVVVAAAVAVLAFELAHRPKAVKAVAVARDTLSRDSLKPKSPEKAGQTESTAARPGRSEPKLAPGEALVRDYQDKVGALLDKVNRTRQKLNDSKRMTQKSLDVLNKIESDLNGVKGMIGTLGTAPTREMQDALKAVIESRLTEIRKQFGEIQP